MLLVTLLIILTTFKVNSLGTEDASSERDLLTIYTLEVDPVCSPDMMSFNFTYNVVAAVRYVRSLMPNSSETFFHAVLDHQWSPGCSMQEASRASSLYGILQDLQKNASNYPGFSVLLGAPLASDCDLVNEWAILGNPKEPQRAQLYQISYYCSVLTSTSVFVNHLADSSCDSLTPPIAAVSVLASNGWKRVALLYDIHTTIFDIPEMLDSILSTLRLSQNRNNVLELLTSVETTSTTNFTSLLKPLEDHLDVDGDDVSQGIFDLLLFSLKSNVTEVTDAGARAERYADIFNLIYVINHPLMLPQPRGVMNWPGDGKGPQRTCGLFAPCGLESVQGILLINLLGMLNAGLIYLAIMLVYRRIVHKTKRFNALKLVFVESDFAFKANDGNPLVKLRHNVRMNDRGMCFSFELLFTISPMTFSLIETRSCNWIWCR
ncbi:unnamed protein product [Taenia asiatica]|uniref:ANF_receptor domain-containing protein n=1 Tax=Taenia asiatica TaxID=60517 RepID=A0A0R3WDQ3_TAEAS|nr:unnamed protein product [Taenia asiatica]